VRWKGNRRAARSSRRWTWVAGAGLLAIGALGIVFVDLSRTVRVVVLLLFLLVVLVEIELLARVWAAGAGAARAEAERSLERARRVQEIAADLGRAVTREAVGDAIVSGAMAALDADRAMVAELVDAGKTLRVLSARGYPEQLVEHWREFSADLPSPMSEAVRSRRPVVSASRREVYERWPGLAGGPATSTGQGNLTIPLLLDAGVLGAVSLGFPGPRRFDEADLTFAATLARQSAVALERARLVDARDLSRREAEGAVARLILVSRASELLAETIDYPAAFVELAQLLVENLADLCLIDIVDDAGGIVRVAAVHRDPKRQHLADALRERYAPTRTGRHPVARVVQTGEAELGAEMPDDFLKETTRDAEHLRIVRELGFQSFICVPLVGRERILGTITFVSTDPDHRYGPLDLDMAREISRRAAMRADNARLFQREQQAHLEAETARSQLAFLADATRVLVSSLDYDVTLNQLAELVVPALADWCVIQLAAAGGQIDTVAIAHSDPDKMALARRLQERYPPDPHAPVGAGRVIRTGESELIRDIPESMLEELVSDPELLAILLDLRLRSSMAVPLTARGQVLGALTLVAAESGRTYAPSDLAVAEELGRRAGIAIDNARLYHDRDYIAQTLQRTLLPPSLPDIPGVELEARYFPLPENEVGGDFYDVFDTGGGAWSIALGDVCGKGPDAAAIMGMARVTIRTAAAHAGRPSDVLRIMSDILLSQDTDQRFCTACYAQLRVNEAGGRLTIACGGHPLPIVIRASGAAHVVGQYGSLLGVFPDPTLVDVPVDLARGDAIMFYTDGILDERRADRGGGEDRLLEVLGSDRGRTAADIAGTLERYLTENQAALPRDDAAFLVVRLLP